MTVPAKHSIFRCATAGLLAGLLLVAAACSAGGGAGPTAAGDANATPGGTVGAAAASDAAVPSCGNPAGTEVGAGGGPLASVLGAVLCGKPDIDPCSMLNRADVQALFSVPLGTSTTDHTGDCTWPLSDPSRGDGLDVFVNTGGDRSITNDISFDTGTPLSGVGDQAVWELLAGYFPHLGALQGQDSCELTIGGGNGQLSVPTTGQDVFAKIDDAALPGFLQELGGLCSQVFAALGAQSQPGVGSPTPGGSGAAAPPSDASPADPVMGHVGDALTFAEFGGDAVDATLVKVFDPATPTSGTTAPLPSGARWVGVEVAVDNHSPHFQDQSSQVDGATADGSTVTTDDVYQGFSRPIGTFAGCTETDGSEQDVQSYTHCVAFVVPDGQTLTQVGIKVGGAEIFSSLVPTDQAIWAIP